MVVVSSGHFVLYSLINGYLGPGKNIAVRTLFECATWCVGTDGCSAFFYSEDDKICRLTNNWYFSSDGLTSAPSFVYYMKPVDNPCESDPCNGHGTCAADASDPPAAVCSCNEGYIGTNCEHECGTDWTHNSGHCYRYVTEAATHKKATINCERFGGYLAIGGTVEEHNVMGLVGKVHEEGFWVGGTYDAEEGTWKWNNGEAITLDLWNPGEPNGDEDENCLEIKESDGGVWNWSDAPCDVSLPYLCEKS